MQLEYFSNTIYRLVEERLETLIPSPDSQFLYSPLFDAARYSVFSGGKRLRPLLVLASVHTLGGSIEKALDPACALELIHTYSLIHDDLPCMDDDDFRRGKPTLHRMYPQWHALLTGDFLLTYAFEVLSKCAHLCDSEKVDLIATLSNRSGGHGMIGGQMIDLISHKFPIDKTTLEKMHAQKTAALISTSLEFGAIIAKSSAHDRDLLKECGIKIGIAFQITDDILDSAPSQSGHLEKPHKVTAISLLGHTQALEYRDILLEESLNAIRSLSQSTHLLEALFKKLVQRAS